MAKVPASLIHGIVLVIWICLVVPCRGSPAENVEGRLVFPELLEGRTVTGERLLRVADGLTLPLSRSAVFGDSFVVRQFEDDGTVVEQQMKATDFEQYLYHDEENMASVTVKEEGGLQVEGVLGLGLRIRPMPESERFENGRRAHLLYEVDEGYSRHQDSLQPKHSVKATERTDWRRGWTVPDVIYPEIYVISDSTHASKFEGKRQSAVEYFGIMVNAVNLRYESVSNPKVRLRILGISLNLAEEDEKYIVRAPSNRTYQLWGVETLYKLTSYVHKERTFSQYDIVFLVTGLDLLGHKREGRPASYVGFAFEGEACEVYKTGIAEDVAKTFIGIHAFAHEVGHILGCPHDGSPSKIPGIVASGATRCKWGDGYIMSYKDTGINYFKFSPCCHAMITVIAGRRRCLSEKNVHIDPIRDHRLPGELANTTQQCLWWFRRVPETYAVTEYATDSCKVECYMPQRLGRGTHKLMRALDGTPCGNESACFNGVCQKRIILEKQ